MAKQIDFRYHKNRRSFSWLVLGVGVLLLLVWTLFQKETLTFLFSLNDPSRLPPEWMNQMEDISQSDRRLDVLTPEELEAVKDHAPVSAKETRTLMRLWNRLDEMTLEEIRDASIGRVLYAQYFKQPETYRGRIVRVRGAVRLIQKNEIPRWLKKTTESATENATENATESVENQNQNQPPQTQGLEPLKEREPQNQAKNQAQEEADFGYGFDAFYELWIQPEDNPTRPVLVNALSIPEDWPIGQEIKIPIVIDGVFFKLYLYEGMEGMESTPCFYAKTPLWFRQGKNVAKIESDSGEKKAFPVVYVVAAAFIFAGLILRVVERRIRNSVPESEPLPDKIDFDKL